MTKDYLKEAEKWLHSPEGKKSLALNARILRKLKRVYGPHLTDEQYKKVLSIIPDYNPINEKDALAIGEKIILNFKLSGKMQ